MGRARPLGKAYGVNSHDFYIVFHFCMKYKDWKEELQYESDPLRRTGNEGQGGSGKSDRTGNLAVRKVELERNIELIENTVKEVTDKCPGLYKYMLQCVTDEEATFPVLKAQGMPCEKNLFYGIRRRFYYSMSKKIKVRY